MQKAPTHQPVSLLSHQCQQEQQPSLPAIPLSTEELIGRGNAGLRESEEKVIPGYDFELLYRKKSHIRLGRKKKREKYNSPPPNSSGSN